MKAKFSQSTEQQSDKRLKLSEKIPLKTPLSMQIELASACNFKCKFCMHGNDDLIKQGKYRNGIMSLQMFDKIVEDLKEFPNKVNFISLQSRGESLLNPNICKMIEKIKKADVAEKIALYTNGSLLTPEMSDKLIYAGLDVLHISIEGVNKEQYMNVAGVDIVFEELVSNIKYFYEHKKNTYLYVKTIDVDMTNDDKEKFLKTFGNICDSIFIEQPVDAWNGAGLDESIFKKNRYKTEVEQVMICPRLFFSFVVHYDGNVVSCDMDWSEEEVIGNVKQTHLIDMWNGKSMNRLRRIHINKKADEIARCRECISRTECLVSDNIDSIADKLDLIY